MMKTRSCFELRVHQHIVPTALTQFKAPRLNKSLHHDRHCLCLTEGINQTLVASNEWGREKNFRRANHFNAFNSWSFNATEICFCDAVALVVSTLQHYSFAVEKAIPVAFLETLTQEILSNYQAVKYHNWMHALDVFYRTHRIILTTSARELLSDVEKFALVLTALLHDVDHPGHNNHHELQIKSTRATRCGGKSVLEHHHIELALNIVKDMGLYAYFEPHQQETFERLLTRGILCTDMAHHFELVDNMPASFHGNCGGDSHPSADAFYLPGAILHSADIGAQCAPAEISSAFEKKILEEFRDQAAKETKLGLTVSLVWNVQDRAETIRSQCGFMGKFVQPLWLSLHQILGGLEEPVAMLYDNYSRALESLQEIEARRKV